MSAHKTWKVLPHKPIEKLSANLWRVQGTLENMSLKRVMAVARRQDGSLVIHNAIALDEAAMSELEGFGTPKVLVVPNGYHRLDARVYKERYPGLAVWCPRGAVDKVSEVVKVDGTYDAFANDERVTIEHLDGVGEAEGVMIVKDSSETSLVLNDVLFNMPHGKGLSGFIFRHITQSTGGPRMSRVARWFLLKDKEALAANLERLAGLPNLKRILVAHHRTIEDAPAETLRSVARAL